MHYPGASSPMLTEQLIAVIEERSGDYNQPMEMCPNEFDGRQNLHVDAPLSAQLRIR